MDIMGVMFLTQIGVVLLLTSFHESALASESLTEASKVAAARKELAASVDFVRKNPHHVLPEQNLTNLDRAALLKAMEDYRMDSSTGIRRAMQMLYFKIGSETGEDTKVRNQAIERLTSTCASAKEEWQPIARLVQRFRAALFTNAARKNVVDCWEADPDQPELALTVAVTQAKETIARMKTRTGRPFILARARLGDLEAGENILRDARNSTDPVRRIALLRELGFARTPAGIRYLVDLLDGSEKVPGTGNGREGNPLSHYVVDVLAEAVEGFPLKPMFGAIRSQSELETARRWFKDNPSYKIAF